jgi:hypothetical protein
MADDAVIGPDNKPPDSGYVGGLLEEKRRAHHRQGARGSAAAPVDLRPTSRVQIRLNDSAV